MTLPSHLRQYFYKGRYRRCRRQSFYDKRRGGTAEAAHQHLERRIDGRSWRRAAEIRRQLSTGDTGNICFTSGTAESGNSGNVTICAGGSAIGAAGAISLVAGESTSDAGGDLRVAGGAVSLTGGAAPGEVTGSLSVPQPIAEGNSGDLSLITGDAVGGIAGSITITTGAFSHRSWAPIRGIPLAQNGSVFSNFTFSGSCMKKQTP